MSRSRTITKILEGYPDESSKDVLEAMAAALWIVAYANYAEEHRDDDDIDRPGHGGDWFKLYDDGGMPEAPSAAYQAADVLGKSLEALNHKTLGEIAWSARHVSTGRARAENWGAFASRVGHALVMESLGTGSRWDDSQPPFPHVVPSYFEISFDGRYLEWSPRTPVTTGGRSNPSSRTWFVVRVDRDDRDTYAAKTLDEAIDLANADEGSVLEYGTVEASDGGAARIMRPARWTRVVEGLHVNPSGLTKKGERMYKAVERGYRAAGDARAKEIAARTVLSAAKHGSRGLVRNGERYALVERPLRSGAVEYSFERAVDGEYVRSGDVFHGPDGTYPARPVVDDLGERWLRNPEHKVGDRVFTPDQQFGHIIEIDPVRADAKIRYEDGVEWWFDLDSLRSKAPVAERRRRGRRNPEGVVAIGDLVVTPDNEVGRVVAIEGDDVQVIHEDRVQGRGPWYFPASTLLEPHDDAAREYTEACSQLAKPKAAGG